MNYVIEGRVVRGTGYGRKIGFPTANLDRRSFVKMKRKPGLGVYTGKARIEVKPLSEYRAGIVVGPLDKKNLPKIEAHLIGFEGNLYGRKIVLQIGKFLRKFKKFKTEKELIIQIKKDLKKCG